jgi:hypothetical protein
MMSSHLVFNRIDDAAAANDQAPQVLLNPVTDALFLEIMRHK